jgi:hypothetical protein
MYYITNNNGFPIAADKALLEYLGTENFETLLKRIAAGTTELPSFETTLTIDGVDLHGTQTVMDSLFGPLHIVRFEAISSETAAPIDELSHTLTKDEEKEAAPVISDETFEIDLDIDTPLVLEEETETSSASEPQETTAPQQPLALVEEEEKEENELIDLLLPTEGEVRVDDLETTQPLIEETSKSLGEEELEPIALFDETPIEEKTGVSDISFDARANAEKIGVGVDDYFTFIQEYIQTAEGMRHQLLSDDDAKRASAVEKLSHLANVLHLDDAATLLRSIAQNGETSVVENFFETLRRYTGETSKEENVSQPVEAAPQPAETPSESTESGEYVYGPIDLSDVKPIHFDFTVDEAANDLSLPTELIEEFIMDFIKQAHEETERMIEAYRKGDLETVQKIGHLLKGTSSNLRITPLADTLYEIQFNDDIEKVPELVRNYWGHFLSLENQMKLHAK